MTSGGIYTITNTINGKMYVGYTTNYKITKQIKIYAKWLIRIITNLWRG